MKVEDYNKLFGIRESYELPDKLIKMLLDEQTKNNLFDEYLKYNEVDLSVDCLRDYFHWESNCGYKMAPPDNIEKGDVLVYHAGSCNDFTSHAVIVVEGGPNAKIACHSSQQYGKPYTYMTSKPYYQWLHYTG